MSKAEYCPLRKKNSEFTVYFRKLTQMNTNKHPFQEDILYINDYDTKHIHIFIDLTYAS